MNSGSAMAMARQEMTVPFDLKAHLIMIKVRVNYNPEEYNFILDTGTFSVVSGEIAGSIKAKDEIVINAKDSNGTSKNTKMILLDNLSVSGVAVSGCAAGVIDLKKLSELTGVRIDGLIGSNFLKNFRLVIDYRKKILTFSRQSSETAAGGVYRISFEKDLSHGFAPKINCILNNGLNEGGVIDTGASEYLTLPMDFKDRLLITNGYRSEGEVMFGVFSPNSRSAYLSLVSDFKSGGLDMHDVPAVFADTGSPLIGKSFLSQYIVTIDYIHNYLELRPYSDKTLFSYLFAGIALKNESRRIVLCGLWHGSPADKSGLRIGDEIISVNSKYTSDYPMIEFYDMIRDNSIKDLDMVIKRDGGEKNVRVEKELY
jgi:predicted aspartyl protease